MYVEEMLQPLASLFSRKIKDDPDDTRCRSCSPSFPVFILSHSSSRQKLFRAFAGLNENFHGVAEISRSLLTEERVRRNAHVRDSYSSESGP